MPSLAQTIGLIDRFQALPAIGQNSTSLACAYGPLCTGRVRVGEGHQKCWRRRSGSRSGTRRRQRRSAGGGVPSPNWLTTTPTLPPPSYPHIHALLRYPYPRPPSSPASPPLLAMAQAVKPFVLCSGESTFYFMVIIKKQYS